MSEQQQRQLREPGRYVGDLSEAVYSLASTGTPQFVLRFDLHNAGGSAYVFRYLSDAAFENSAKALQRMGFNGDFNKPQFSAGSNVELTCKHKDDPRGGQKEEWDIGGGWMPEKADPSAAQQMNAKWRGLFGAQPTRAATPQNNRPVTQAAPPPPASSAAPPPPPDNGGTFRSEDGIQHTKTSAWEKWVQHVNPPDYKRWAAVIAKVADGKKTEAQFTGDDWAAVANEASPI